MYSSNFISDYASIFDIVLMDIEMPHMNGMETARKLREKGDEAQLIFITNMAQYAIRGYDVNALGFIVKPVEYFNFCIQIAKAVDRVISSQNDFIALTRRDLSIKLYVKDIRYVEVLRHRIIYHTVNGNIELTGSMKEAEEVLSPYSFVRCNSNWLVNLRHVSSVRKNTVSVGDDELMLSRNRKQEFLRRLADYFAGGAPSA